MVLLSIFNLNPTILFEQKGVNIISRKTGVAPVNIAGGGLTGHSESLSVGFRSRAFLGSNKHLDWPKIDLNAAKIITFQDNKHTEK